MPMIMLIQRVAKSHEVNVLLEEEVGERLEFVLESKFVLFDIDENKDQDEDDDDEDDKEGDLGEECLR